MENRYWQSRKRASSAMARKATSSRARLVHYELSGRYSSREDQSEAVTFEGPEEAPDDGSALDLATHPEMPDQIYYSELEAGAEYLAEMAYDPSREKFTRARRGYTEREPSPPARLSRRRSIDGAASAVRHAHG